MAQLAPELCLEQGQRSVLRSGKLTKISPLLRYWVRNVSRNHFWFQSRASEILRSSLHLLSFCSIGFTLYARYACHEYGYRVELT